MQVGSTPDQKSITPVVVLPAADPAAAVAVKLDIAKEVARKKFTYQNIVDGLAKAHLMRDENSGLLAMRLSNDPFYYFGLPAVAGVGVIKAGWKFHIAINDAKGEEQNLKDAWDIVKNVAIDYGLSHVKVTAPDKYMATDHPDEPGSQITIYAFKNPHISPGKWQEILARVTLELAVNVIKPGPCSYNDKPVLGSNYVTYRNDMGPNGKYILPRAAKSYNDSGEVDPFQQMKIIVAHAQPAYALPPPSAAGSAAAAAPILSK
jgi:hypothetical protein